MPSSQEKKEKREKKTMNGKWQKGRTSQIKQASPKRGMKLSIKLALGFPEVVVKCKIEQVATQLLPNF